VPAAIILQHKFDEPQFAHETAKQRKLNVEVLLNLESIRVNISYEGRGDHRTAWRTERCIVYTGMLDIEYIVWTQR